MKNEHTANASLQAAAAERARWAAVLAPVKPATPRHADHVARGYAQAFRPLQRLQWLLLSARINSAAAR